MLAFDSIPEYIVESGLLVLSSKLVTSGVFNCILSLLVDLFERHDARPRLNDWLWLVEEGRFRDFTCRIAVNTFDCEAVRDVH